MVLDQQQIQLSKMHLDVLINTYEGKLEKREEDLIADGIKILVKTIYDSADDIIKKIIG